MWSKFYNYYYYERSYHHLNFIKIWPEKPIFLRVAHGSSSKFRIGTMYGLKILHKCDKWVENFKA